MAEDEKIEKLQAQLIDVIKLQSELEKKVDELISTGQIIQVINVEVFEEIIHRLETKLRDEYKNGDMMVCEPLNKKISELEKHIKRWDKSNVKRIEKLENHIHHDLKLKGDQNFDEIREIYQELSELKSKQVILLKEFDDHVLIIAELKELSERNRVRVDELKEFRHDIAMPRIIDIEEVLWELCQRMGDNEDLCKLGYDLLAKLNGGEKEMIGESTAQNRKPSGESNSKPPKEYIMDKKGTVLYETGKKKAPEPLDAELLERIRNIKLKPMKTIGWFKRKLAKHHPDYKLVEKADLKNFYEGFRFMAHWISDNAKHLLDMWKENYEKECYDALEFEKKYLVGDEKE